MGRVRTDECGRIRANVRVAREASVNKCARKRVLANGSAGESMHVGK